jgi:hypothetical protein
MFQASKLQSPITLDERRLATHPTEPFETIGAKVGNGARLRENAHEAIMRRIVSLLPPPDSVGQRYWFSD